MRNVHASALLTGALTLAASIAVFAQAPAGKAPAAGDGSRAIAGGGIQNAPGWTGKVDANEAARGMTVDNAKFVKEGNTFKITTGPAITYWNPADKASGDYTVKATFTEPKYMNLNTHPHPYGIVVGGNDMGTPNQTELYCAAYGNGNFIVRGFGPDAFQLNGRAGASNPAVHKAAGVGQPVSQDIAISVKGGKASCIINGTTVASYDQSEVVGSGKLKSLDGIYGLRFAHNTEVEVIGFQMTKN
ncbi:MAG TPA: hypothetical protein VHC90_08080 [Bryobacteraceae bacterium]|nr:hypothetical protein [Bryobacteraceae bacterium]